MQSLSHALKHVGLNLAHVLHVVLLLRAGLDQKRGQRCAAVEGMEGGFGQAASLGWVAWVGWAGVQSHWKPRHLGRRRTPYRTCCRVEVRAPRNLQFMMLPFRSLLKPPFLKGCDELPTTSSPPATLLQPTATSHPYLHGGGERWTQRRRAHASVGQRKNRQVARETTSRSFYPTLKYLEENPGTNRPSLPARKGRRHDCRLKNGRYRDVAAAYQAVQRCRSGKGHHPSDFSELAALQTNEHEAELLRNVPLVVEGLDTYSKDDQARMLECLDIIVGGQILDLERFGPANEAVPLGPPKRHRAGRLHLPSGGLRWCAGPKCHFSSDDPLP